MEKHATEELKTMNEELTTENMQHGKTSNIDKHATEELKTMMRTENDE
jgi:hypothetical protein